MIGKTGRFLAVALFLGTGCIGADIEQTSGAALPEGVSQQLVDAARANLERVSREIDNGHLANYGLGGSTAQQFVDAVIIEYRAHPVLLKRRLETLASMVFFSAPEVQTSASLGRLTPFHGMDDAAFEALMQNEDFVFEHHMEVNGGSPNGVRPFSVCETKFLISISKGAAAVDPQHTFSNGNEVTNYDAYAQAFKTFAATCPQADLDEWYNFRGLGGLRPSWLESNISDRFLRRMASSCQNPPAELAADCAAWNTDRLAYRDRKNTEFALREVYYDPRPETTIAGTMSSPAEGCHCGQYRAAFDCMNAGCNWGDGGNGNQCVESAYPTARAVCALDGDEASCTADSAACRWTGAACGPKNDWAQICGAVTTEDACNDHESGNCWFEDGACKTYQDDESVEDPCTGHADQGSCLADAGCGFMAESGQAASCRWVGTVAAIDACSGPHEMSFEEYMLDPNNAGVFVEDRNGDGIGEWIADGTLRAREGGKIIFAQGSTFETPAELTVRLKNAATLSGDAGEVNLAAGTEVVVSAGTTLTLVRRFERRADSTAPVQFNANTEMGLSSYSSVKRGADELRWEGDGNLSVTLAAALSLPLAEGAATRVSIDSGEAQFQGDIHARLALAGGATLVGSIWAGDVIAYDAVDPAYTRSMLDTPDLGLQTVFADGSGCTGSHADPATCGLVRRFYSLIDRHENFYQTYSSLRPSSSRIGQQPSPFVACSITLAASHAWDSAGTPPGGSAGFIYLMRIPFRQIFAGDVRSVSTLGLLSGAANPLEAGPQVTTVQEVYEHGAQLDMSKLWFDIATLSHNEYESEHEISKFGSVPSEQIEGILVIRRPAAMGGTPGDDEGGEQ